MKYIKRSSLLKESASVIVNRSFGITQDDIRNIATENIGTYFSQTEPYIFYKKACKLLSTPFGFDNRGNITGLENFPSTITLYRIISLSIGEKPNVEVLGESWTLNKNCISASHLHKSIGLTTPRTVGTHQEQWWVFEATFTKEQVRENFFTSVYHLVMMPLEQELNMKGQTPQTYKTLPYYEATGKKQPAMTFEKPLVVHGTLICNDIKYPITVRRTDIIIDNTSYSVYKELNGQFVIISDEGRSKTENLDDIQRFLDRKQSEIQN